MTPALLSHLLLWGALFALALVCLALARQVGVLHERLAPAGALAINQRLRVGDRAPDLVVPSLDGQLVRIGRPLAPRAQLLFFLAPDCPVCKTLLPAFKSAAAAEHRWIDAILLSDGEGPQHARYVRDHGLNGFPYVVSESVGRAYGVGKLPYAVVINPDGRVASMGLVNTREHLDSLFEAKERGVASIQDFVARQGGAHG